MALLIPDQLTYERIWLRIYRCYAYRVSQQCTYTCASTWTLISGTYPKYEYNWYEKLLQLSYSTTKNSRQLGADSRNHPMTYYKNEGNQSGCSIRQQYLPRVNHPDDNPTALERGH